METILVTGGCGYIGSHTCICLVENGYNVVILDSLINSFDNSFLKIKNVLAKEKIKNKGSISFIKGDVRNEAFLDELFLEQKKASNGIAKVIHFAGLKCIYESIKSPLEYWEVNVQGTITLLKVMKKHNCFSLIFSSSASVYKPNSSKLLNETDILSPSSPYGETKLAIENILKDLFESDKNNWRIASLRYFNPVGSHFSGFISENPKGKSANLFPAIIKVLKNENKKLLVFGNNWPTKDGTCIRDFIHVLDLADAHIATLDFLLSEKPQYLALNIGTGKGRSILEIINQFNNIEKGILKYDFAEKRLGDYPIVVADNKLALKLLNWFPKRSLIDMCKDTMNIVELGKIS